MGKALITSGSGGGGANIFSSFEEPTVDKGNVGDIWFDIDKKNIYIKDNTPFFTELSYIESTGAQYIDTGIKATDKISVEITFSNMTIGGNENILFGASNGSWANHLGINNPSAANANNIYAYFNYDGRTGVVYKTEGTYKLEAGKLYYNGTQIYSNTYSSFSYDYNIYLFGDNWQGNARNFSNYRLINCKIWNNNVLVRDFIPIKRISDNSIGLLDIINYKFYQNEGTGVFNEGMEIFELPSGYTQVEYLLNDGKNNSYIDLTGNINCNSSNYFYMDTYFVSCPSGWSTFFGGTSGTGNGALWLNNGSFDTSYQITASPSVALNTKKTYTIHPTATQTSCWLFRGTSNTAYPATPTVRIYKVIVKDVNNKELNKLIPCKKNSTNILGYYDILKDIWFPSTGTFTEGTSITNIPKLSNRGTWVKIV